MNYIDLHTHSTASDGKLSPSELVKTAKSAGLKAIALTDHDTIHGIDEFIEAGKVESIETVPGVEIEVQAEDKGFLDIHILGLFIDQKNKSLNELLDFSLGERVKQKKLIVEKLNNLGYSITFDEVLSIVKKEVGRPHIAKVLLKNHPDKFSSISDVFDKLIERDKPAYVPRLATVSFDWAIKSIHSSGGLAILAHPFCNKNPFNVLDYFVSCGGDGVETVYCYKEDIKRNISRSEQKMLLDLVKSKKLLESGGSDFHGTKEWEPKLGTFEVPGRFLQEMKKKVFS